MAAKAVIVLVIAGLLAGCGSDDSEPAQSSTPAAQPASSARPASLVGRWERVQTCGELAHALDQADLSALAPSVLGDFFAGTSARKIARKKDLCKGADPPRRHSHFFNEDGSFGSLDQDLNQVDEDPYRIVDDHTLQIGRGRFRYRIADGDTLILHPVITAAARRRALSDPFEFSTAGWQVAVAYEGLPWKRVRCYGWC